MTTYSAPGAFVRGEQKAVDVQAIEKELAALWRDASGSEAVTRACLWNTLVHTVDGAKADKAQEDLQRLSQEIPSRAILIRTDASSTSHDIDAWISANCQLTGDGRKHVCCEEITILARGRTMSELPALARALLAPDVPSVLFWMEEPSLAGRHLPDWLNAVDRFVFDSAAFQKPSEFRFLLDGAAQLGRPVQLGDLNWHRLKPWRILAARAFDQPGIRSLLSGAVRITISGDPSLFLTSGALFGAWWAERLGYDVGTRKLTGKTGATIPVVFEAGPGDIGPGGLTSVRFDTGGARLELCRHGDSITLDVGGDLDGQVGLNVAATRHDRSVLWAREMEEYAADPVLARVLPRVPVLLGPQ